jgi:hypothetical protein
MHDVCIGIFIYFICWSTSGLYIAKLSYMKFSVPITLTLLVGQHANNQIAHIFVSKKLRRRMGSYMHALHRKCMPNSMVCFSDWFEKRYMHKRVREKKNKVIYLSSTPCFCFFICGLKQK